MLSKVKYRAQLSKDGTRRARRENEKESGAGIMHIKRATDDEVIQEAWHAIAWRALFCIRERDLGDFRTSPRKSFPGRRRALTFRSRVITRVRMRARTHGRATTRS